MSNLQFIARTKDRNRTLAGIFLPKKLLADGAKAWHLSPKIVTIICSVPFVVALAGIITAFRESVPLDPVLYDHSIQLLQALNWTGLAMVEFKVGAAGPKLMEINGRVWGS